MSQDQTDSDSKTSRKSDSIETLKKSGLALDLLGALETQLTWLENDDLRDDDVPKQDAEGDGSTLVSLDRHHGKAAHGTTVVPRRSESLLEG